MSVYNAVGEGPLSPPHEVFVGEAGERDLPFPPPRAQPEGIRDPSASAPPSPPPAPPRSPLAPHPSPPLTPSSAHGSTPQRGCPRRHGHTAGRDLGAPPAGKPEWRHPGLQGTGATGPTLGYLHTDHSNIEGLERNSPSLPCLRAG